MYTVRRMWEGNLLSADTYTDEDAARDAYSDAIDADLLADEPWGLDIDLSDADDNILASATTVVAINTNDDTYVRAYRTEH